MPIEAVVTGVDLAADEPLGMWLFPIEHLLPFLEPVQGFRLLCPEGLWVALRVVPEFFVDFGTRNVGLGGEVSRRRKEASFLEYAGNVRIGRGHAQRLLTEGVDRARKHQIRSEHLDVQLGAGVRCEAGVQRMTLKSAKGLR